ncbi:MAG: hypothetical protein F9K23_08525 [Bacteroidetes bacterium]|nr:MAG: hypothetical protein F9K23_08525 [Bacteroidota bacterium]
MNTTSTPHPDEKPEPDPVNFYRVASERHLNLERPTGLFTVSKNVRQVPNSKFTSTNALIAKATEMVKTFEDLSERHNEPYRVAGPANAVKEFISELELHIAYHNGEEPGATHLQELHARYTKCLERFECIDGMENYL